MKTKLLTSPFLVPAIYFLALWPIWLGWSTFGHDTADGLSAFKWAQFPPVYWNWLESGGHPFWFDMAFFRTSEPLAWLAIFPLKLLPISTITAYNIYALLRIVLLGVGASLLLRSLHFSWWVTHLGTCVVLFGSLGTSAFEQSGVLDLTIPFVFICWCLVRLGQTGKSRYVVGAGLATMHGVMSYHLLFAVPVFFIMAVLGVIFFRSEFYTLVRAAVARWKVVLLMGVCVALVAASHFVAVKEKGLLPLARTLLYNSFVNKHGKNLNLQGGYAGSNVFQKRDLSTDVDNCHKTMHCSEYAPKWLPSFVLWPKAPYGSDHWAEYTGFIGRAALILALAGLWFTRAKLGGFLGALAVATFFLSLGSQGGLWPFLREFLPGMKYVRHTHSLLGVFVLLLVGLFCLGIERAGRDRRWRMALVLVALGELAYFHAVWARSLLKPIYPEQRHYTSLPLPKTLESRALRSYNPYPTPRTGVATAWSLPLATEAVEEKWLKEDAETSPQFLRLFGFVTPFMSEHYLRSRLYLSDNVFAMRKALGVHPNSVFTLHSWSKLNSTARTREEVLTAIRTGEVVAPPEISAGAPAKADTLPPQNLALEIIGETLAADFESPTDRLAYLSLPFAHISRVLIDGKPVPFHHANVYGIAFGVPAGRHRLFIQPDLSTRNRVFLLFYFGYFLALFVLSWAVKQRKETVPSPWTVPAWLPAFKTPVHSQ